MKKAQFQFLYYALLTFFQFRQTLLIGELSHNIIPQRNDATIFPTTNTTANNITIIAAQGTFIIAEINSPTTPHTIDINIDNSTIILNRGANISAII